VPARIGAGTREEHVPNTSVYHLQLNVSNAAKSLPFYQDFFKYLGYRVINQSKEHIGVSNGSTDFWIIETPAAHRKRRFHRKATGLNHISFRVSARKEIDRFVIEFLKPRGIVPLYASPKHFPEYRDGYYAVFFEDPDRIKLELTFIPAGATK